MKFPAPVPELPVADVQDASSSWAARMGFNVDWTYEDAFAGISRDAARIFLRRRTPLEAEEGYSVTIWLNMESQTEVDQLYSDWKKRGVPISTELHTSSYNLREFTAQDPDGNKLRVFYDLGQLGGKS